jgi:biopolymer transport protein ExbD
MKPLEEIKVDVDMVPMIDIITLLLMFLVVVGGMAASASTIQMKLPRADQAVNDGGVYGGRIVIQLQNQSGVYRAVINNKSYDLAGGGGNKTLLDYLDEHVRYSVSKGMAKIASDGAVDIPVKLRIPADAPMRDVEKVIMSVARVGMVHVQYAADPLGKEKL